MWPHRYGETLCAWCTPASQAIQVARLAAPTWWFRFLPDFRVHLTGIYSCCLLSASMMMGFHYELLLMLCGFMTGGSLSEEVLITGVDSWSTTWLITT